MDPEATSGGIHLEVHEAPQADVGLGRARIDAETRAALHVNPGDVLKLIGKGTTPAVAFRLKKGDEGKGIVRIDGLVRSNLDVSIGEKIEVQRASVLPAERLTIAPIIAQGHTISFGRGIENFVKRGLLSRYLNRGDVVIVPSIALLGGALPFKVVDTAPEGVVQVREDTLLTVHGEPVREGKSSEDPHRMFLASLEGILMSHWDRLERLEGDMGVRARKLRDEVRRLLDDAKQSADKQGQPEGR